MEAINPNRTKENKRSKIRRALLIVLVFTLCITTFCITAFAVNGNTISKNGGQNKWYAIISGPGNSDNGVTANTVSTTLTFKSACTGSNSLGGVGAYCVASITINGNNKQVWNKSGFGLHSAGASKQLGSHSVTCYKTTYAWNAAVKGAIWLNSGSSWSGTSTASTTAYISAKPYYSCYCDPNGGSGGGTVGGYYGDTVYLPGTPSRTGYNFAGWSGYGASTAFAAQNLPGGLTAGWNAKTYSLTVNPNGGTLQGSNFGNYSGTTSTASVGGGNNGTPSPYLTYDTGNYCILGTATRTGYVFNGFWTATSGGTQIWNASGSANTGSGYWNGSSQWVYDGGVTVYAQWTEIAANLTYDANGHGTAPGVTKMTYLAATTLAAAPSNPTGYVFKEWNTKADGTGTGYAPGAKFKEANVTPTATTLYAIWKHPGTITITKTWDDDLQGSDQSNRTPPEITIKGERVPQ